MKSLNESSLSLADMPRLWLANQDDYLISNNTTSVKAPLYLTGWSLRPGFHVEAEVGLIIRRFIKSSMLRDLVFNLDPVSLFSLLTIA